jgi:Fic-DOC domain mobile mystery protein B
MRFEYAPGATPIDPDEAKGLIPAHLTLQRELNEYEESNILEATAWLFARRRGDPLDERFIHVVHGRMFNQTWKWAGKSRRADKNVGVSWFEIPVRLRQMLGDVRAQIEHQAYSYVEIAARYHHRLVAIHVFGRTTFSGPRDGAPSLRHRADTRRRGRQPRTPDIPSLRPCW